MRTLFKIDHRLHYEKLEDLIDAPKVIRVNEFDEKSLEKFEEEMDEAHATGQPIIPIVIDSYGGAVYGAQGMITAIETARVPVATVLTSKAMSAGAMLFCFGTEGHRYMHPEAGMMIHEVGAGTYGKVEEMKIDVKHFEYLNERFFARASKHLGHAPGYLSELIAQHKHIDWFLTAKEAKKHKIANHLYVPAFEIDVSVKVNFG